MPDSPEIIELRKKLQSLREDVETQGLRIEALIKERNALRASFVELQQKLDDLTE